MLVVICFLLLAVFNCMGMYSNRNETMKKVFGQFNPREHYRKMQLTRECRPGQLDIRFLSGVKAFATCIVVIGHVHYT